MINAVAQAPANSIFNGLPFRGKMFDRKEADPEKDQPILVYKAHVKVFDTSKKEDLEEYETVWNKSMRQEVTIGVEDRQYNKETNSWLIFMRWADQFYTNPPKE